MFGNNVQQGSVVADLVHSAALVAKDISNLIADDNLSATTS